MSLPKPGDLVSVDKFHISEMNVRYGQPFGESEEDLSLIDNLRRGKIVQKFIVRPEGDGFGVVVGRRRFLAKREAGFTQFEVGYDFLIEEMTDVEAVDASWTENLGAFRKGMDPIARAEGLNRILAHSTSTMRSVARRKGIPETTMSEWLKPLELSERMREAVRKGVPFRDSLKVVRLKLSSLTQDKLAEVYESEGLEAFKREVERLQAGKGKRGVPKGVYEVDRLSWDKRSRREMNIYGVISQAAESKGVSVSEYIKDFLIRNVDLVKEEI